MLQRFHAFVDVPAADPDSRRRKRLLNILLGVQTIGVVLGLAVVIAAGRQIVGDSPEAVRALWLGLGVSALLIPVLYILNRYVSGRLAGSLFIILLVLLALVSDAPEQVILGRGLIMFSLPIFLSSMLLRSWASFPTAAVASLILVGLSLQEFHSVPNAFSILVFFFLAVIAWLSSSGLERTLERMRDQEALLTETGRIAKVGGWEFDARTLKGTWSEEVARIHDLDPGLETNAELGMTFYERESRSRIERAVQDAIATATPYDLELELTTAKGNHKWIRTIGHPVLEGESVVRVRGAFQDITGPKESEQALRAGEQKYRETIRHLSEGFYSVTLDGTLTDHNPELNRILGFAPQDDLTGMSLSSMWQNPDERNAYVESLRRDGVVRSYPISARRKDGTLISIEANARLLTDAQGSPIGIEGAFVDVTSRAEAEQALSESRAHYQALFQHMLDGYAYCRMEFDGQGMPIDFEYLEVNPSFERLTGLKDVVGRKVSQVIPGVRETNPELLEIYGRVSLTAQPERFETYLEALRIWFSVAVFSPKHGEFVAVFDNVTERKRAEGERDVLAEQRKLALDAARMGWWRYDPVTKVSTWDDRYKEIFGVTGYERPNEEILARLHPDDLPHVWAAVEAALDPVDPKPYATEYRVNRSPGDVRWVEAHGIPTFEGRGEQRHATSFVGTVLDITERKGAEDALRASEERYRTVAEFTYDWEYWRAADGTLHYMSPSCERITGYSATEFLQDPDLMERIVHPEDREHLRAHHAHADSTAETRRAIDIRMVRRDGEVRWINHSCLPVFDREGRALGRRGSNRDITERRQAEDEVRRLNADLEQRVLDRTAQLEATNAELEAFSYSVSHDLRAPLRGIDGWSLALLEDYASHLDDQARLYLNRVRSETQRMGSLIDDLLQLSRVTRAEMEPTTVDLSALAETIAARLRDGQPERQVKIAIEPGLKARGDEPLLEVVLTNLLDNAWKFTAPRPAATIEVGRVEMDGRPAFFVRDNGVGFDMAYAGRLFGAFQRLHKLSEFPGTGIGLATVQRILLRHGGRIWSEALPGRGATFYFTLMEVR